MYSDDEEKRGFPVRDFLIRLVLIIIFVLLLMWLLPTRLKTSSNPTDLSPLTNRIFNANIQTMKEAAIPYFTTERLPKNIGDEAKLTLQQMLDKKLLLPFTDKDGKTCDTQASYVTVTKEEDEYLLKVYLKCGSEEDYILVHIGCYSYCTSENGVCEKQEEDKPTTVKPNVTPQENKPKGPSCSLEIASGSKGQNGWYVGNVKVRFKSKTTATAGAKITKFGISTSSTVTYNENTALTVSKDGTTTVYGYVKDSNGKTAVCTITVKKDSETPNCSLTVLNGVKNSKGNYVGTVRVGFASRTDATSGVNAYGMDVSSKATYNSKKSIDVSTIGKTTVYGFVKDKAGHTKVCSAQIQIDKQDGTTPKVSTPSCSLEVASGTLGNDNWYRSDVVVRFKSKASTNGATITGFGIGTSENYNGSSNYTINKDGSHVIKGYVKDSNGNVASCSISVKRDATKPSCSLGVSSGTISSDGSYTSDITIGWKSRTDATSGVNSYGLGKTENYSKNTSYTVTTTGKHTVYGYIKDNAGNTNICSINVEKKTQSYEYQYSKSIAATYSAWSSWKTSEYNCNFPPSFTNTDVYEAKDLGAQKVANGYAYVNGKAIRATQVKQTGVAKEVACSGWTYYRDTASTTRTYAIKVAEDWKYVGLVSLASPPTDTLSVKYEFVGMDWDRCGSSCTTTPYTVWKKYTRNVSLRTAKDTIVTGSSVSVQCTSFEEKDTILFTTYNVTVGYEQTRVPQYKTVCNYSYRNRNVVKAAYVDYKWSYYNDQKLINEGYKMTGTKRLVS